MNVYVMNELTSRCVWLPADEAHVAAFSTKSKPQHPYEVGHYVDALDQYKSRFTGEPESKWRLAEVLAISSDQVLINYVGWGHNFDAWLPALPAAGRIA